MKRMRISLLPLIVLIVTTSLQAAPTASKPVQIPVSPDAQVRLALSNSAPNMIVVPGDKIVAIDSAQGAFINDSKGLTGQRNGGVVLMTTQTEPFTFYVRTEGGLTVSVIGVPQHRDGRVVHLVSDTPIRHEKARSWEQSHPYVTTLIAIQKAVLAGEMPEGFKEAPVAGLPPFSLPFWLKVSGKKMWNGGELRLYQLDVKNVGSSTLTLPERIFQSPGVRSVMVFPYSTTIMPQATAQVWVTVSDAEGG